MPMLFLRSLRTPSASAAMGASNSFCHEGMRLLITMKAAGGCVATCNGKGLLPCPARMCVAKSRRAPITRHRGSPLSGVGRGAGARRWIRRR